MKIVKRIVVVLVLCLAVVGVHSLLKKTPELNLSEDDVTYLEKEFGKSSSTTASREGLSGVMMNVEGAPPITGPTVGFEFGDASNAPPAFMTDTPAPGFVAAPLPGSFDSEAPVFGSEAPAFVPSSPAAPVASPYQEPQKLDDAPTFEPAPTPSASPVDPFVPERKPEPVSHAPPRASVYECAVQEPLAMSTKTVVMQPPIETSPPFREAPRETPQEVPIVWNGPITEVIHMPSSVPVESQEGLAVLEPTEAPFSSPAQLETVAESVVDMPIPQVTPGEELRNETPIVALSPYKRLPVVMESPALKTIPKVDEEDVVEIAQSPPPITPSMSTTSPVLAVVAEDSKRTPLPTTNNEKSTGERYRQTSVRKDIAFSKPIQPEETTEPVISFLAPQTAVAAPENTPLAAPSAPNTEVMPFVEADAPIVYANVASPKTKNAALETKSIDRPPAATPQEVDLAKVLRPTVTRFVRAQTALADSGDPIKMRNAFIQLSKLYEQTELNDAERNYMKPTLDRLALSIVYSRNIHILEPAHVIKSGETIESIAKAQLISPALLRKINGLSVGHAAIPGTELKVVLGRFDAKISTSRNELTLILGGLYAGSFPIRFGERAAELRGECHVTSKTNSLHGGTLTLNNGAKIGSGEATNAVRLNEQDAGELFDILTEMSVVVFEN